MKVGRPLTSGERSRLSDGLSAALDSVAASPAIVSGAHPAARIAAAWRGAVPIVTRGDAIFWPGAAEDFATDPRAMAILQHELQHVLDYRTGRLTAARYLLDPREWVYGVEIGEVTAFDSLGAEQRATLAERLWLAENGRSGGAEVARLRALIPWAAQAGSPAVGAQGAA